jgi:glycerol kinase
VSEEPEATARGIAALAGEAAGLLGGAVDPPEIVRRVAPRLDPPGRARERDRWREAVEVHMRAET